MAHGSGMAVCNETQLSCSSVSALSNVARNVTRQIKQPSIKRDEPLGLHNLATMASIGPIAGQSSSVVEALLREKHRSGNLKQVIR